jgi:hypothetical protein
VRDIFILSEIWAQDKIFYLSLTVPVLAPNYKKCILSPPKVKKVLSIRITLCEICLFEFIRMEGAQSP